MRATSGFQALYIFKGIVLKHGELVSSWVNSVFYREEWYILTKSFTIFILIQLPFSISNRNGMKPSSAFVLRSREILSDFEKLLERTICICIIIINIIVVVVIIIIITVIIVIIIITFMHLWLNYTNKWM